MILLGSDYYESLESIVEHEKAGKPRIGIGANCRIENTIVDKNARIGNNVVISPAGKPDKVDHHLITSATASSLSPRTASSRTER